MTYWWRAGGKGAHDFTLKNLEFGSGSVHTLLSLARW